ncbi:hypothetical protein HK104_011127 [Borealophlyctis nickersoniae]|nr:hypothetical protein HK104_011127 [Borealophlyctis nickersoniae]
MSTSRLSDDMFAPEEDPISDSDDVGPPRVENLSRASDDMFAPESEHGDLRASRLSDDMFAPRAASPAVLSAASVNSEMFIRPDSGEVSKPTFLRSDLLGSGQGVSDVVFGDDAIEKDSIDLSIERKSLRREVGDNVRTPSWAMQSPGPLRDESSREVFEADHFNIRASSLSRSPELPASPDRPPLDQGQLFQSEYDTVTRNHLNALVSALESPNSSQNSLSRRGSLRRSQLNERELGDAVHEGSGDGTGGHTILDPEFGSRSASSTTLNEETPKARNPGQVDLPIEIPPSTSQHSSTRMSQTPPAAISTPFRVSDAHAIRSEREPDFSSYPSNIDFLDDVSEGPSLSVRQHYRPRTGSVPASAVVEMFTKSPGPRETDRSAESPMRTDRSGGSGSGELGFGEGGRSKKMVLIRNMGGYSAMMSRLGSSCNMSYNEEKQCWEGNEDVLQEIAAVEEALKEEEKNLNDVPDVEVDGVDGDQSVANLRVSQLPDCLYAADLEDVEMSRDDNNGRVKVAVPTEQKDAMDRIELGASSALQEEVPPHPGIPVSGRFGGDLNDPSIQIEKGRARLVDKINQDRGAVGSDKKTLDWLDPRLLEMDPEPSFMNMSHSAILSNSQLGNLTQLGNFTQVVEQAAGFPSVGNNSFQQHSLVVEDRTGDPPPASAYPEFSGTRSMVAHLMDALKVSSDWAHRLELDLSGQGMVSVQGLAVYAPNVTKLKLNDNKLTYLTGLPECASVLHLCNNRLSNLTSFTYLRQLQYLDISRNFLTDLSALLCLSNLRELHAANNQIDSCRALQSMRSLLKANLRDNRIRCLEFGACGPDRLEMLDVSCNEIEYLDNFESLTALRELILDQNAIKSMSLHRNLPNLEILSLNDNAISVFDGGRLTGLRRLYLDRNALGRVEGENTLEGLELLSLESQRGSKIPRLETLELRRTGLKGIPKALSQSAPRLRHLDLDDNAIVDVRGLKGLQELRSLHLKGNNIGDFASTLKVVKTLERIQTLDMRCNPITARFYIATENPPALYDAQWSEADAEFRKSLSDSEFVRRLCYRSKLISSLWQSIRVLDGIQVAEGDKRMAAYHMSQLRKSMRESLGYTTPGRESRGMKKAIGVQEEKPPFVMDDVVVKREDESEGWQTQQHLFGRDR